LINTPCIFNRYSLFQLIGNYILIILIILSYTENEDQNGNKSHHSASHLKLPTIKNGSLISGTQFTLPVPLIPFFPSRLIWILPLFLTLSWICNNMFLLSFKPFLLPFYPFPLLFLQFLSQSFFLVFLFFFPFLMIRKLFHIIVQFASNLI